MINVDSYLAWFSVVTDHGDRLEFVLDDVGDRTGTDYYTELENMLKAKFKSDETVRVEEIQVYYDVSFLVGANSPDELQWALRDCKDVVERWINKYRINSMKRNGERA